MLTNECHEVPYDVMLIRHSFALLTINIISVLKVIKLFSSSAQLSLKFQVLINVEIVKISEKFRFNTQQLVMCPAHKC